MHLTHILIPLAPAPPSPPLIIHQQPPPTPPAPLPLTVSNMEVVWHSEFDRLFSTFFPHSWFLMPTALCPDQTFHSFHDSAKVRFLCENCGHGWTSMKGRVVFWFYLDPFTLEGGVYFKLFGQQCQRCQSESFEHAMWYPEEVYKVLYNMYNKVGQAYYHFTMPTYCKVRRAGKPRSQHESNLCQACQLGLCAIAYRLKKDATPSPPIQELQQLTIKSR